MRETSSILLTTPTLIVAALPHLLGFHPRESLVSLWMSGGELLVLQRADLPDTSDALSADVTDYLDAYLAPSRRLISDGVVSVCVTRRATFARKMVPVLSRRSPVPLRSGLVSDGSRVRDALHSGSWEWISTADRHKAAKLLASSCLSSARGPLLDRAQVLAEVEFDPALASRSAAADTRPVVVSNLIEALRRAPAAIAGDARLIADHGVRVEGRDALLWWAARIDPSLRRALLDSVLAALRLTPPGRAAHLASLGAAIAWMCGDGVRANAAVDRCLTEEPEHVLGRMINAAMTSAVPPSSFIAMLEEIDAQVVGLQEGCVDGSGAGGYSRQ